METQDPAAQPLPAIQQIGKIALALSKAQGVMTAAVKDRANDYFKSSYADLASCWEACRQPLATNELAIIQIPVVAGSIVSVRTILAHSSGESIEGEISAAAKDAGPQSIGSCVTYLRRYGLCAMVGISPEDDDGNAAQNRNGHSATPAERTEEQIANRTVRGNNGFPSQPAREQAIAEQRDETLRNLPPAPPKPPTPQARLKKAAIDNGVDPTEVPAILASLSYPPTAKELTEEQFLHLERFALVNAGRIKRGEEPWPEVAPDGGSTEAFFGGEEESVDA